MKTLFILIISLISLLSPANSVANKNESSFLKSFQKTVEFNKGRFANINLVYPGDTVMVVRQGIIPVAIMSRDSMPGYHDCVWYAVKRTFEKSVSTEKPKLLANEPEKIKHFNLSDFIKDNLGEIITTLLAGIFLLLLALLIVVALRRPVIINNNIFYTTAPPNYRAPEDALPTQVHAEPIATPRAEPRVTPRPVA